MKGGVEYSRASKIKTRKAKREHTEISTTPNTTMVRKLPRYESERKPPRSERRNTVPIKLVTRFADFDRGKCISLNTYVIKLFPTAAIAIISKAWRPECYSPTSEVRNKYIRT